MQEAETGEREMGVSFSFLSAQVLGMKTRD